jgi:LPXTG-motif cell wall-anchored protein
MNRPLLVTIILSVAAVANGYASPAATILQSGDGLQSANYWHTADPGCEITGSTADSLYSPHAIVTRDSGETDGDMDLSGVAGALPTTRSEPISYVLIGSSLIGLGSFARRRRRRTNE